MKLRDLCSLVEREWVEDFVQESGLTEGSKTRSILEGVLAKEDDSKLLIGIFGDESPKHRKSFNQTCSTLYKELLTYLQIHHRYYPDHLITQVRKSLATGVEQDFLSTVSRVERILIDTENFEAQLALNTLVSDFHRLKSVEHPEYLKRLKRVGEILENLTVLHEVENYFQTNDLLRRKRSKKLTQEDLAGHRAFLESHFISPIAKVQVMARILWLRLAYQFNVRTIVSEEANSVLGGLRKVVQAKPFLSHNVPSAVDYSLLAFTVHTRHDSMPESEFEDLIEGFYSRFDAGWLQQMFPNTYWSLLTIQVKYFMEASGLRFIDDPRPISETVRNGMTRLLDRIIESRQHDENGAENKRIMGLISEALCRFQLGGEQAEKASDLLEVMLVQEQQTSNARLQHTIYFNLCQFYFLSKQWDRMMDTREKYLRFTKVNGEFDPTSAKVMEFQYTVSSIMLGERSMSAEELDEHFKEMFKGSEPIYDRMVPYVLRHLNLASKSIS